MDEKEKQCCGHHQKKEQGCHCGHHSGCEDHHKEESECDNKCSKHSKQNNLQTQIDELNEELKNAKKTIEDQKTTINSYLSTASYYKNELESNKKDFDRLKERNKNIEVEANSKANENVAKKLLPILDNFDQAISHVDESVMKGFSMIYASLANVLSELGIVEISAKGEKLNPEKHNCIATEPTDDTELEDTVATIYQKGYVFAETGKIVRPATVSVYKLQ